MGRSDNSSVTGQHVLVAVFLLFTASELPELLIFDGGGVGGSQQEIDCHQDFKGNMLW